MTMQPETRLGAISEKISFTVRAGVAMDDKISLLYCILQAGFASLNNA